MDDDAANPANTTTINVKAVDRDAWQRAKNAADKQDETMGVWLSRALNFRCDAESGPREFLPTSISRPALPAANPPPQMANPAVALQSAADVAAILQGLAAVAAATGAAGVLASAVALADDMVRAARGMPPRPVRRGGKAPDRDGHGRFVSVPHDGKAPGKALLESGKAEAIDGTHTERAGS